MIIYIKLGLTYYNKAYFNIGATYKYLLNRHSDNYGSDYVTIQLGLNGLCLSAERHSCILRIRGGALFQVPYIKWLQENYSLGDQMKMEVLAPDHLVIHGEPATVDIINWKRK